MSVYSWGPITHQALTYWLAGNSDVPFDPNDPELLIGAALPDALKLLNSNFHTFDFAFCLYNITQIHPAYDVYPAWSLSAGYLLHIAEDYIAHKSSDPTGFLPRDTSEDDHESELAVGSYVLDGSEYIQDIGDYSFAIKKVDRMSSDLYDFIAYASKLCLNFPITADNVLDTLVEFSAVQAGWLVGASTLTVDQAYTAILPPLESDKCGSSNDWYKTKQNLDNNLENAAYLAYTVYDTFRSQPNVTTAESYMDSEADIVMNDYVCAV
ncbi:hypothetical protein ADUPG1_006080 [Aduncisulcus paluster]|uniref:Phospholipase C/D domain-containing protein n=1 Tax=Aduncisulcus paluster TaxID=2918883 RepID=A0ABQ5KK76_9EUKA|nr:hypothetical protein ADUPG1_006080 [Aduncisulcus paluster]